MKMFPILVACAALIGCAATRTVAPAAPAAPERLVMSPYGFSLDLPGPSWSGEVNGPSPGRAALAAVLSNGETKALVLVGLNRTMTVPVSEVMTEIRAKSLADGMTAVADVVTEDRGPLHLSSLAYRTIQAGRSIAVRIVAVRHEALPDGHVVVLMGMWPSLHDRRMSADIDSIAASLRPLGVSADR